MRGQQGVHSLEVFQKFYEIINEKPRKAKMEYVNMNKCSLPRSFTLDYQAVINLVYENSKTKQKLNHMVWASKKLPFSETWMKLWTPKVK